MLLFAFALCASSLPKDASLVSSLSGMTECGKNVAMSASGARVVYSCPSLNVFDWIASTETWQQRTVVSSLLNNRLDRSGHLALSASGDYLAITGVVEADGDDVVAMELKTDEVGNRVTLVPFGKQTNAALKGNAVAWSADASLLIVGDESESAVKAFTLNAVTENNDVTWVLQHVPTEVFSEYNTGVGSCIDMSSDGRVCIFGARADSGTGQLTVSRSTGEHCLSLCSPNQGCVTTTTKLIVADALSDMNVMDRSRAGFGYDCALSSDGREAVVSSELNGLVAHFSYDVELQTWNKGFRTFDDNFYEGFARYEYLSHRIAGNDCSDFEDRGLNSNCEENPNSDDFTCLSSPPEQCEKTICKSCYLRTKTRVAIDGTGNFAVIGYHDVSLGGYSTVIHYNRFQRVSWGGSPPAQSNNAVDNENFGTSVAISENGKVIAYGVRDLNSFGQVILKVRDTYRPPPGIPPPTPPPSSPPPHPPHPPRPPHPPPLVPMPAPPPPCNRANCETAWNERTGVASDSKTCGQLIEELTPSFGEVGACQRVAQDHVAACSLCGNYDPSPPPMSPPAPSPRPPPPPHPRPPPAPPNQEYAMFIEVVAEATEGGSPDRDGVCLKIMEVLTQDVLRCEYVAPANPVAGIVVDVTLRFYYESPDPFVIFDRLNVDQSVYNARVQSGVVQVEFVRVSSVRYGSDLVQVQGLRPPPPQPPSDPPEPPWIEQHMQTILIAAIAAAVIIALIPLAFILSKPERAAMLFRFLRLVLSVVTGRGDLAPPPSSDPAERELQAVVRGATQRAMESAPENFRNKASSIGRDYIPTQDQYDDAVAFRRDVQTAGGRRAILEQARAQQGILYDENGRPVLPGGAAAARLGRVQQQALYDENGSLVRQAGPNANARAALIEQARRQGILLDENGATLNASRNTQVRVNAAGLV